MSSQPPANLSQRSPIAKEDLHALHQYVLTGRTSLLDNNRGRSRGHLNDDDDVDEGRYFTTSPRRHTREGASRSYRQDSFDRIAARNLSNSPEVYTRPWAADPPEEDEGVTDAVQEAVQDSMNDRGPIFDLYHEPTPQDPYSSMLQLRTGNGSAQLPPPPRRKLTPPSPNGLQDLDSRNDTSAPLDIRAWRLNVPSGKRGPDDPEPWSSPVSDSESDTSSQPDGSNKSQQNENHTSDSQTCVETSSDPEPGSRDQPRSQAVALRDTTGTSEANLLSQTAETTCPDGSNQIAVQMWRGRNFVDWWRKGSHCASTAVEQRPASIPGSPLGSPLCPAPISPAKPSRPSITIPGSAARESRPSPEGVTTRSPVIPVERKESLSITAAASPVTPCNVSGSRSKSKGTKSPLQSHARQMDDGGLDPLTPTAVNDGNGVARDPQSDETHTSMTKVYYRLMTQHDVLLPTRDSERIGKVSRGIHTYQPPIEQYTPYERSVGYIYLDGRPQPYRGSDLKTMIYSKECSFLEGKQRRNSTVVKTKKDDDRRLQTASLSRHQARRGPTSPLSEPISPSIGSPISPSIAVSPWSTSRSPYPQYSNDNITNRYELPSAPPPPPPELPPLQMKLNLFYPGPDKFIRLNDQEVLPPGVGHDQQHAVIVQIVATEKSKSGGINMKAGPKVATRIKKVLKTVFGLVRGRA